MPPRSPARKAVRLMSKPKPALSGSTLVPPQDWQAPRNILRSRLSSLQEVCRAQAEEASRKLFIDLSRDYRRSVYLAGDGRSGTTWISEIINCDNRYRYMFEPFHPSFVPLASHFRFFSICGPIMRTTFLRPRRIVRAYRSSRVDEQQTDRRDASSGHLSNLF